MYLYKIGYGSYEESDYAELKHAHSFTEEEITGMVGEAIIDILKARTEDDYYHSYQDVHRKVIEWLIENKGFTAVEYEQWWSVFGWASIFCKEDWRGERDAELNRLTGILNEVGYGPKDDDFLTEFPKRQNG